MSAVPDVEKKLFGRLLVEAGLITAEQLEIALEEQKTQGGRIGFNLVRLGFLTPAKMGVFLQENLGIGLLSHDSSDSIRAAEAVPRHLALYYKIAPIKVENGVLTVAIADVEHPNLIQALSDITGFRVDPLIYPEAEIRSLLDECYRIPSQKGVALNSAGENTFTVIDFNQRIKAPAFTQLKYERDVGEWLRGIIAEAIKEKSREILIQPESEGASILFRKETFFLSKFSLYPQLQDDFTFFLYRLAKMNPVQQNRSQSGRFLVKVHDRKIVIAVNAFPTIYGTRFLLEMFDEKLLRHSYDELSTSFADLKQQLEDFVMNSYHGMCIITGPEGSGRTSFLYTLLSRCKDRFSRIVTLEHSVRYPLHGISQTQVEEGEMEGVLESVLKQKPDLVAIHSLTSVRAAEIAFLIAARVPLIAVMSCYDSFVALEWLCRHHLKSAIKAGLVHTILSPRLIPRSCPSCARTCELTDLQKEEMRIPPGADLKMNPGCEICKDATEKDAEIFFEYICLDQEMISWIERTGSGSSVRKSARQAGRKTLLDRIVPRAATGELDMLSVLKLQSIH